MALHYHALHAYRALQKTIFSLTAALLLFAGNTAQAMPIDIVQLAGFINSPGLGATTLEDTRIGSGVNDVASAGFDVSFVNNLNADNFGSVTWSLTNRTGANLNNVSFFAFLDAEITETGNSFYNEFGERVSVTGSGATDSAADSWEIDEPGFLFGDIYDNLLAGALDNINNVPNGLDDDVSLALGFDIGDLLMDQVLVATLTISTLNIGGLSHTDPDSLFTYYFNGIAEVIPIEIPLPPTWGLMLLSFVFLERFKKYSGYKITLNR